MNALEALEHLVCHCADPNGPTCPRRMVREELERVAELRAERDLAVLALGRLAMGPRSRRAARGRTGTGIPPEYMRPEQCCALNADGSRCTDDGFQGWHFCHAHLTEQARTDGGVLFVEDIADQSPIRRTP